MTITFQPQHICGILYTLNLLISIPNNSNNSKSLLVNYNKHCQNHQHPQHRQSTQSAKSILSPFNNSTPPGIPLVIVPIEYQQRAKQAASHNIQYPTTTIPLNHCVRNTQTINLNFRSLLVDPRNINHIFKSVGCKRVTSAVVDVSWINYQGAEIVKVCSICVHEYAQICV